VIDSPFPRSKKALLIGCMSKPHLLLSFLVLTMAFNFVQSQTNNESPLTVLSQQAPNASAWVLSPLEEPLMPDIRQNLTFLREDLIDEGKAKPAASLEAYRIGYQLCNSILAALDQRDEAVVQAGLTVAQANARTEVKSQALEARRNYMMSWPQYHREDDQREEFKRQAINNAAIMKEQPKLDWLNRVKKLRSGIDKLYMGFRAALREDPQATKVMPLDKAAPSVGKVHSKNTPALSSYTNSLGMRFIVVPDTQVLMCIHETRNSDYAVFADSTPGIDISWKTILPPTNNNMPVVGVSYNDAIAFCQWLGKKEGRTYRLPTDHEWSLAVGIGREERQTKSTTPETLSKQVLNAFPWGAEFPPTDADKSGNYADTAAGRKIPNVPFIAGYTDGFAYTAPVMSFKANDFGFHDLGGNVWEWVEDWYNSNQTERTLRGNSWIGSSETALLSSRRDNRKPDSRGNNHGFRIVTIP